MYGAAAIANTTAPLPNGDSYIRRVEAVARGEQQFSDSAGNTPISIFGIQMVHNAWNIIVPAAIAVGENWAAKKSGARRATQISKKWGIF